MQQLEVSCAVRCIYKSLGFKGLKLINTSCVRLPYLHLCLKPFNFYCVNKIPCAVTSTGLLESSREAVPCGPPRLQVCIIQVQDVPAHFPKCGSDEGALPRFTSYCPGFPLSALQHHT